MELEWGVLLPHPEYSPDIVPTDYHLFISLQHTFGVFHFRNTEDIKKCIHKFLTSKPQDFFRSGIHQLPDRWQKVIESRKQYFQEQ